MTSTNIKIDGDRLWQTLMEMAKIGPGIAGGNNRQTLTDTDSQGRSLFARWCEASGMTLAVDQMGTMYATRPGTDPDLDPICVGSHLDTQPTGGRYDGVLGVLAGLELVRTLNDAGIATRRPIMVANFTNEEGTRFAPAMLASGVYAGIYTLEWAHARCDEKGKSVRKELERLGWLGEEKVGARRMHSYFELHIEQGPMLEASAREIGVVTNGQGLKWYEISVRGKESHSGSTPMSMRYDAGLGMARIIELARQIADRYAPDALAATGRCALEPNSINTVPGKAVFTVDFRHRDKQFLEAMARDMDQEAHSLISQMGLELEIAEIGSFEPVAFDPACVKEVRKAAQKLGYRHMDIVAGAGHDACWINRVVPTAMIMCPCVGGLSHNEAEEITPEWAEAGTNVLLHAVLTHAELSEHAQAGA